MAAMASKLNALAIVLVAAATLVHLSTAQTRHVVGDATGWTIPSGGASTYDAWAANQTFTLGDTLVFNFTNGQHDVAKVKKADFDACNTGNVIFTITDGPASVNLNETGEQFYICTFGNHCSLGQKLAINVSRRAASSSPSPQPAAPPTSAAAPAIAPAPSGGSVTYTVGDKTGWVIPSSASSYQTWASGKSFKVGDVLVFNFSKNQHNVAEVTKAKYDSCDTTSPLAIYNDPPVRVTLNKSGEHYFICAVQGHCSAGQKLAINVTTVGGGGNNGATPPPPPSIATSPSSVAASPNSPPSTVNPSSPSPTGVASSPPPQNSDAASLGFAGLFATVLWIPAALLY
ncbi:blue copper protein-like [Senna tora]|uniref:Blue copper protein-like n=1 Tax=Senna tora TaxID=362788 RepID=A0A834X7S9_9FABA|nr:blue copper protein-like [Senna tora]